MKPTQTLRRWDVREVRRAAVSALCSTPRVIGEGWRADALRRVLFVPALMGTGIGLYFALAWEPSVWLAAAGIAAAGGWVLLRRWAPHWIVVAAGAAAAVAAGFSVAIVRTQMNDIDVVARETRMMTAAGRVARVEPADRGRMRVWLDVEKTTPRLPRTPRRVRLSVGKTGAALSPGDWIRVRGTLRPLPAPVAPGASDFGRKLWFEGIGAVGFSLAPVVRTAPLREETAFEGLTGRIQAVRHHVSERIRAAMSPRAGPIAAALLTGERGLIADEDNEAMRDSSLAHLLSISGLHMALAGFGFFMALRFLFALVPTIVLNHPVKKWAATAALAASFAYLLLSGASVPTQRAFVMIAVSRGFCGFVPIFVT